MIAHQLRPLPRIPSTIAAPIAASFTRGVNRVANKMTPDQRRKVAKTLRDRVYGSDRPDVRDTVAGMRRRRRVR